MVLRMRGRYASFAARSSDLTSKFSARLLRVELPGVPRDTAAAVERRLIHGLARLEPEERLARTMALCRAASELAIAGIRLREGDLPETELRLRVARLRYGPELVERVQAYRARRTR
jgi:hypothetical protein